MIVRRYLLRFLYVIHTRQPIQTIYMCVYIQICLYIGNILALISYVISRGENPRHTLCMCVHVIVCLCFYVCTSMIT
jgi:hypothetical protein